LENMSTTVRTTDLPPTGKSFNKVHQNVTPNLRWNWEGLQQACWTKVFRLVLLANRASPHKLANPPKGLRAIEGSTPPHDGFLNPFMTSMGMGQ
jgi:hypothetical protein